MLCYRYTYVTLYYYIMLSQGEFLDELVLLVLV